jgi:GDPmannose 4,6-dehydratase
MKKRALITGVNGMDGSYMADLLLSKDYEVFGMERIKSSKERNNTKHIENKINYITADLTDQNSLIRALVISEPEEIYNFASQSFVGESWDAPEHTSNVTGLGALRMLEAIREVKKPVKFYQASSSEMFGMTPFSPQNESTPFYPRSPYGVAKLYGHWITKNYRESYNMFNVCGILFNHESERRGKQFVTRKISLNVAKIIEGKSDGFSLGTLDAKRDWGYAPNYVEMIWKMLQQNEPDDYVIATGKTYSVRDFVEEAFAVVGIKDWEKYVSYDKTQKRPADTACLIGDPSKAVEKLGWKPDTTPFKELVRKMVENDIILTRVNHNG